MSTLRATGPNIVSVADYGAMPGIDWAHAIDCTNGIQMAINANPGKKIFIPAGYYKTSSAIAINSSVELIGEGKHNTQIQPIDCNCFIITASNVAIKDIFIYGFSSNGSGYTGIWCDSVSFTTLDNLQMQNLTVGIRCDKSWNSKISRIDMLINPAQYPQINNGIEIHDRSVNNHISNCHIESNSIGISILKEQYDPEGLMIDNCYIGNSNIGIYSTGILSLHLNNCIIDLISGWAICATNTRGMLLSNCWIATLTDAGTEAIHLELSFDCIISNNNIKCCNKATRVISILNGSHGNIFNNNVIRTDSDSASVIYIDKTASYNQFSNNFTKAPNGTPRIADSGTSNIFTGTTPAPYK